MGCGTSKQITVVEHRKTRVNQECGGASKIKKHFRMEDTFWEKKKILIPDYERMKFLDQHALDTPKELSKNADQLVKHLLKVTKNTIEKYRVIFRWEAEHVDFNDGNEIDTTVSSILETDKSSLGGYATLYKYLCELASLECEIIQCPAKYGNYLPGDDISLENATPNSNKIQIKKQWYLCDWTWITEACDNSEHSDDVKKLWNESSFICDPQHFICSHFYDQENEDRAVSQSEIQEFEKWKDDAQKTFGYFTYGINTVSHHEGVIQTPNNKVLLRIRATYDLNYGARLVTIDEEETSQTMLRCGEDYSNNVMTFEDQDDVCFDVRLPCAGSYSLTLVGKLPDAQQCVQGMSSDLLCYTIKGTGNETHHSFPGERFGWCWGVNRRFLDKGFSMINAPLIPILKADSSTVILNVKLPNRESSLMCALEYTSGTVDEKLLRCVSGEKNQDRAMLHILIPYKGEYHLKIMAQIGDDGVSYIDAAHYLIQSQQAEDVDEFPENKRLWGPSRGFYEIGLETDGPSRIVSQNGTCNLRISKPSDIDLLHSIEHNGSKCLPSVFADGIHTGLEMTYRFRLPSVGYYWFKLFGKRHEPNKPKQIGEWLIENTSAWKDDLFPDNNCTYGPNDDFHKIGLRSEDQTSSHITAENGTCQLVLLKNVDTDLSHTIEIGGNKDLSWVFADGTRDGLKMTYKFRLPLKGFYTFKLFGQTHVPNQSSSTYPVIGSWMLECKSEWKGELYPDSKTTYGPVDVFHSSGLSLKGGNSSHIIAEDGTCCVVITKPSDVELIHDLKRDDVKQRKCSFEDHRNDGTESYFLLRLPERGYYQLNLFAKKGKHGSNYPYAGTWLIESKSPWQGELYPLQDMAWGVDDEFTNLGLQLEGHNSSRIVAIDGKCVLAFKTPSPISTKFQLYSDERRIHEKKTDEYIEVTSDIKMICFSMELPDPGFYKFELYGNLKEKENLPYLGCWLIEYER